MSSGQSAFPAPARPGLGSSERLVAYPEVTPFWSYFRIGGKNEAAGAAVAAVVAVE